MSRVLSALRAMGDRDWTTLSDKFSLDVKWFIAYASQSNGVALIHPLRPEGDINCDSSLVGGGGVAFPFCYTWRYSQQHVKKFAKIHELEAVNILVAVKTLASRIAPPGARITVSELGVCTGIGTYQRPYSWRLRQRTVALSCAK